MDPSPASAARLATNLKPFTTVCMLATIELDGALSALQETDIVAEMQRLAHLYRLPQGCASPRTLFLNFYLGATNGGGANGYATRLDASPINLLGADGFTYVLPSVWSYLSYGLTPEHNYRSPAFWIAQVRQPFEGFVEDWNKTHP